MPTLRRPCRPVSDSFLCRDQSLDDFAFFRDGDDVISVAESRVAFFIATVRVSETKVGNRIDHRRSALVVVIAPDGSPRNAERFHKIHEIFKTGTVVVELAVNNVAR